MATTPLRKGALEKSLMALTEKFYRQQIEEFGFVIVGDFIPSPRNRLQ